MASTSRLIEQRLVDQKHAQVARLARELLQRAQRMEAGAESMDAQMQVRARRVQLFQSQPMFVAEPYTPRLGVYIPVSGTVRGYSAIAEGQYDALPEEAFRFVGTIEEVAAKAHS